MKTRWMLIATAVVAMGCLKLIAAERPNAGGGPLHQLLENAKELNLTDDQKTKLQALVKEFAAGHDQAGMREKAKNNPELRETLKEMKTARDSGDEAKAKELRQKMMSELGGAGAGKDGAARGAGHGEFIQKLAQILTPEQMQKLKAMREANGGGEGGRSKPDTTATDKASKPDASKGVPKVFE